MIVDNHIKQALDLGAGGVLGPMVNSPEEARAAVAACRYPPQGIRGFGPRLASEYYRRVAEYVAWANESVVIALQIEYIEAVKSIVDIMGVPGIDVICLGPNDLSGSMGLLGQVEHPSVVETGSWRRAPAGGSRFARGWPSRRPSTVSGSPGARASSSRPRIRRCSGWH